MRRVMERARLLALLAVAGLTLTATATLVWALVRAVNLVVGLVGGGWREDASLIALLEVVDLFLVGTVQLIVLLGLYELFVGDLDLPEALTVRSVGELKRSVVEVLVVVLAIKFLEEALAASALDTLWYGLATAVIIGVLVAFTAVNERSGPHG